MPRFRTHRAQRSQKAQSHFRVAISYASENSEKVGAVAKLLSSSLGRGTVFYDKFESHAISGFGAKRRLRDIYRERADLVVVFFDAHYARSTWCRAEWQSIRQRHASGGDVMLFHLDDHDALGLGADDLHLDARELSPEHLHGLIVKRLDSSKTAPRTIGPYAATIVLLGVIAMGLVRQANPPDGPATIQHAHRTEPARDNRPVLGAMPKSTVHAVIDATHEVSAPSRTLPMHDDWEVTRRYLSPSEAAEVHDSAEQMLEDELTEHPGAWESMRKVNRLVAAIDAQRLEAWRKSPSRTPPPPPIPKIGQQRSDGPTPGGTAIAKPTERPPVEPPLEKPPTQRRSPPPPPRVVLAHLRRTRQVDGAALAAHILTDQTQEPPEGLRLDVRGVAAPVALVVFHAATGALVTLPPCHASGGEAGFELPAEIHAPELHLFLVELAARPSIADLTPLRADQPLTVSLRPLGA